MQLSNVRPGSGSLLKHSLIGVLSLFFLVLSLAPIVLNAVTSGLVDDILSGVSNIIFPEWILLFLLVSLVLSILDLGRPGRSRTLPLIALILGILIFVLIVLYTIGLYISPDTL